MATVSEKSKYQIKTRLIKGDKVVVIAGKDKGKSGLIEKVDRKHDKVFVAGVNISKRHTKPSMANPQGGIEDKTLGIAIGKVMLVDPKSGKPTRVGFKIVDGKKVRFAKKSGSILTS